MEIPAAIMPELRILHPDEAEAGREMLRSISRSMKRKFPADEAAFLTMHVLNETRDEPGANTTLLFSRVHQVTALVESTLGEPSALTRLKDSAEYARFVLHVKFMIQRIAEGIMLAGEHSAMFEVARNSYPRAYETAKRVRELISSSWNVDVTDEELLYLIVHIERLAASTQM